MPTGVTKFSKTSSNLTLYIPKTIKDVAKITQGQKVIIYFNEMKPDRILLLIKPEKRVLNKMEAAPMNVVENECGVI